MAKELTVLDDYYCIEELDEIGGDPDDWEEAAAEYNTKGEAWAAMNMMSKSFPLITFRMVRHIKVLES